MSEECPSKNDLAAVFKKLRSYPANKVCFDCGAKNPTWSSVTYGVFICIDCSAVHRSLGVHLSFVRSTQLDTNWTWLQMRAMQLGGNSNATQFFRQHGCTSTDAQQKYKSRAAQLYREKLHHLAVAAMRTHGTKLHVESSHGEPQSPTSPVPKEEVDFFAQHTDDTNVPRNDSHASISEEAYIGTRKESLPGDTIGPSVEGIIDDNVSSEPKKVTMSIGQRRNPPKKGAGKKGAFGAQKMSADFSEIEKQAEVLEKTRITPIVPVDTGSHDSAPVSARFLAQESVKREEQLKKMDPKKLEQAERLGMALDIGRGKASHSVLSEIKTISQDEAKSNYRSKPKEDDFLDKDWEILRPSPVSREPDRSSDWTRSDDNGFSVDRIDTSSETSREQKTKRFTPTASDGGSDAQKKFGGAKAISSDQFFGASGSDYEVRSNLARFEGSNAISSADLFGGDSGTSRSRSSYGGGYSASASAAAANLPDMTEIKDSVRQGVTKVAGKISQLSNSVSTYLSDHYGN